MTYSQGKEEDWIIQYFKGHIGTVLDLGANDGVTLSNSRALIEKGWSGVCVDASPKAYARLQDLYLDNPRVETHHLAIGDSNDMVPFFESDEHLGKGDIALVSTLVPSEIERWHKQTFEKVMVEQVTFATLLERCERKTFDLISIDIEGMDLCILRQMNLDDLKCNALIVEFNGKDEQLYRDHVEWFGLKLRNRNSENLWFCR